MRKKVSAWRADVLRLLVEKQRCDWRLARLPTQLFTYAFCTRLTDVVRLLWQCAHKVWCAECTETEAPSECPVCDCTITQALRTYHKRF